MTVRSPTANTGSVKRLRTVCAAGPGYHRQPVENRAALSDHACRDLRGDPFPRRQTQETFEKARYYLDWGVLYVWIVDPAARTAWIVTPDHRDGIWIHPDGALTAGEGTEISLSEIFAEVDKMV